MSAVPSGPAIYPGRRGGPHKRNRKLLTHSDYTEGYGSTATCGMVEAEANRLPGNIAEWHVSCTPKNLSLCLRGRAGQRVDDNGSGDARMSLPSCLRTSLLLIYDEYDAQCQPERSGAAVDRSCPRRLDALFSSAADCITHCSKDPQMPPLNTAGGNSFGDNFDTLTKSQAPTELSQFAQDLDALRAKLVAETKADNGRADRRHLAKIHVARWLCVIAGVGSAWTCVNPVYNWICVPDQHVPVCVVVHVRAPHSASRV